MSEVVAIWLTSGLLLVISIILLCGRGSFMIAGFNTMSKAKKARYNVVGLCRLIGIVTLLIAITMPLLIIESIRDWYVWFYLAFIIIVCIIAVVIANTKLRR